MDKEKALAILNKSVKNTLMETLGITYTAMGDDWVEATMPVTPTVHQPAGILHGGASVALAESLGSASSHLFIDHTKQSVVGLEINANHLKSIKEGMVTARATIIHKGRSTHLWDIRIRDEKNNLICICRLTNLIKTHA
ncbi:MAG: hotdog fold thioesterase [Luteibaculaceae bacterium]